MPAAAAQAGYAAIVTVDQGIPTQMREENSGLAIIVIRSRTNQLEDLLPLASAVLAALESIQPGQTVIVPPS